MELFSAIVKSILLTQDGEISLSRNVDHRKRANAMRRSRPERCKSHETPHDPSHFSTMLTQLMYLKNWPVSHFHQIHTSPCGLRRHLLTTTRMALRSQAFQGLYMGIRVSSLYWHCFALSWNCPRPTLLSTLVVLLCACGSVARCKSHCYNRHSLNPFTTSTFVL